MSLQLIPANEYRRERWRNGLGWTKVIFTQAAQQELADEPAYDWRLSIAEVDNDCAFSAFPGCDRVLMLLSGNGMELQFDDGTAETVAPPHGRVAFAGERGVQCRLLDGPTTDFNVIVRRDRCTMQVYHRPLVGSMVFFAEAGVLWAIHLIAGRASIKSADKSVALNAGDTVLLDAGAGDAAERSILDGGGDAILVRLQRI
jgi:environmental stress-induced protein Ves